MEHSIYNGKLYSAYKITEDKNAEDLIRAASSNKELYCKECGMGIRYRHGDKNRAHFSHIVRNEKCIYCIYDNMQKSISAIKYMLFEHFVKQGYNVELEVKILKNHYTDLVITLEDGQKIAIEFISKQRLPDRIEKLHDEYNHIGIQMQLIIVQKNKRTYEDLELLKMFYTNDDKNQRKFVIHAYDMCVYQYAKINIDIPKTENGFYYDENFHLSQTLDNITVKNGILTLKDYDAYLKKRQDQIIEQYKKHLEWKKKSEERKVEIENIINQSNEIAYDSSGIRWVKCQECGKIDEKDYFASYGGDNINSGICKECSRK